MKSRSRHRNFSKLGKFKRSNRFPSLKLRPKALHEKRKQTATSHFSLCVLKGSGVPGESLKADIAGYEAFVRAAPPCTLTSAEPEGLKPEGPKA